MDVRWYVSFHGGADRHDVNAIHAFAADGEPLGPVLDAGDLPPRAVLRELRGFAFGPDGNLYVANAFRDRSQILRFGGRPDDRGRHPFLDVFAAGDHGGHAAVGARPALAHPFDVAFGPDGHLYVPNQDSRVVARYAGPTAIEAAPGAPLPLPPALAGHPPDAFPPGTFVPAARDHPAGLREVRHALFGPDGLLYVADRAAGRVKRYDAATGEPRGELGAGRLRRPIHLLVRPDGALLVGDRDADAVFACDPGSGRIDPLVAPGAGGLREPAGLALGADGALYVASRGSKQLLRFDPFTGRPDPAPFADRLPDHPEFLRLVDAGVER